MHAIPTPATNHPLGSNAIKPACTGPCPGDAVPECANFS